MHALRTVVVLSLALGGASSSTWAADALFAPMANREFVSRPGPLLKRVAADVSNARIELVAVNADAVSAKSATLALALPGGIDVEAKRTSFQRMESGNEVWVGEIDMGTLAKLVPGRGLPLDAADNSIIAVRSGHSVLANIRIGDALYRLMPVEKGAHALVEVDQSKFLPDEDAAAYAQMQRNAFAGDVLGGPLAPAKAISTVRVMVAFGASATASIGNEQQALDLAFSEANQALANTNTDVRFAQAGAIRFYTQGESSTYSTMLARLTNMSDGWYDTIGSQRNSSTGDIVAYVAPESSTLCGQAAGIGTPSAEAYFVISWSCLSGGWTFVHEAAHVVGARHDTDSATSPHAYAHGYVMRSINRRTVMAVNNGPCSSCTRFPAFSSPDYTLSGVTIGTASFNDNTRLWRNRGPTVAAFR